MPRRKTCTVNPISLPRDNYWFSSWLSSTEWLAPTFTIPPRHATLRQARENSALRDASCSSLAFQDSGSIDGGGVTEDEGPPEEEDLSLIIARSS